MQPLRWETPARRAAGPGAGLRLQGLERRRRGRLRRAARSSARRSTRRASRRSTPRSSSTSRRPARRSRSSRAHARDHWPEVEVYEARVPRAPRDLVLLSGPEPSYPLARRSAPRSSSSPRRSACSWSSRSARCWPTCRTRGRCSITGLASDEALVERLGLQPPSYEGPTGIVGVLHDACAEAGHAVGLAVGGGAALRRRGAEPEGRARARAQAREPRRRDGRRARSSRPRRPTTSARSSLAVELDPDVQAFVERLERGGRRGGGRPTRASCPPATSSRASSSASCASAAPGES